jgi:DNA-binding NarL/FixJ family response regulator
MEQIANWVISNKEWLFSGIAVAAIGLLGKLLYPFFKNGNGNVDKQSQSQNNSQTQNVTFNLAQHSVASIKSIDEAKEVSTALTLDGIRAQTNILFIDDDKDFKIVPILKKAGWKNTSFFPNADVKDTSAEKIRKAHIIFIDIKGVGKTLYEDEGLGLVVDLKKKYPQKKIVIYSAIPEHQLFHEAIKLADDRISKNSQPAVFVSLIESLAEDIWKNV